MPTAPPPDWVLAHRRVLGDCIRELRRERRISQQKLAGMAGLERQAINRIEQGHQTPYMDTVIRIAAALDVELRLAARGPDD
ncbi:helix-turn-helix transcriptional regulator [Streptomyces sp. SID13726]|nr:helix-turn-helix transcriptional regulator [Streptomyces sp. SID13726]